MAKQGTIQTNLKREKLAKQYAAKRAKCKAIIMDKTTSLEEKFAAQLKFGEFPRNSARIRFRNRCAVTGRPRAFYRRFKLSRIVLRQMASYGMLPGVKKASW